MVVVQVVLDLVASEVARSHALIFVSAFRARLVTTSFLLLAEVWSAFADSPPLPGDGLAGVLDPLNTVPH